MKSLIVSLWLLLGMVSVVHAQTATTSANPSPVSTTSGQIKGLYDEEDPTSTISASPSATPVPRATTYLDPTDAPESGATENTILLLGLGITLIIMGVKLNERFSRIYP